MLRVLAVIVNFQTADLTLDCLRSLSQVRAEEALRVVVVDNASKDGSVEKFDAAIAHEGWMNWVTVRALETNGGFAVGNNAALRPALRETPAPDYFWLLNSDTRVHPGALEPLLACMQDNPRVGIAGSRLEDADGTVQCSAFRFPTVLGEFGTELRSGPALRLLARWVMAPPAPGIAARTAWVAGASMFVRRAVFQTVGLLDENFFMYFDDVDLCRRAARAGWQSWYVPASRVVHLVGQSSHVTDTRRAPVRRPAYWFDARRYYYAKHHSTLYAALADAAWLSGYGIWRVRRRLQKRPDNDPPRLWRDFLEHSLRFP